MPRGRRPVEQTKSTTKMAQWRARRGMTQKEVAEACGMALATYVNYEADRARNQGLRQLSRIARALGCELEDLIEDRWRPDYGKPAGGWTPEPSSRWRNKE